MKMKMKKKKNTPGQIVAQPKFRILRIYQCDRKTSSTQGFSKTNIGGK